MLDFLGHESWGSRLLECIEQVLVQGDVLTPDLGGTATTEQVARAVLDRLQA
jgi:tartrate dehydrogenase/decarboxylase/D-malate dehydrogenase